MYLIINIDQLTVHTRTDHFIADCSVDRIGKVNRRRTIRKVLHVSVRGKAIYILRKQVQISFEEVHKFPVVGHIFLPLQDLSEPAQLLLFLRFYALLTVI